MRQVMNTSKLMVKYKHNYASIVTLLNLSVGCLSLLSVLKNERVLAVGFILIGILLDRLDGQLARKLDTVTDLGRELDSLADLVSFGVAPAMLLWSLSLNKIPIYGSGMAIIFILSGAYRLARFNVSGNDDYFIGMPITIAGGLLAIASALIIRYDPNPYLFAALTLVLSLAMITNTIKFKKI